MNEPISVAQDVPRTNSKNKTSEAMVREPHLMMCSPDFFAVNYQINPWMDPAAWAKDASQLYQDAQRGWQDLIDVYRSIGAKIELQPPREGLPDMVFTANSAVVLDRKVLMGRFLNSERRGEEVFNRRFFEYLKARGIVSEIHELPSKIRLEGAGDAVWDAHEQIMWMGHGQRSDRQAAQSVENVFGVRVVALELASAKFYHLDTCFCVLSSGHILWYPKAFKPSSQSVIQTLARDRLIAVSRADAEGFAINSVSLGEDLVMCRCSAALRSKLESLGHRIHLVPLKSFNRSGGAGFCLTLRVDNRSQPKA